MRKVLKSSMAATLWLAIASSVHAEPLLYTPDSAAQ